MKGRTGPLGEALPKRSIMALLERLTWRSVEEGLTDHPEVQQSIRHSYENHLDLLSGPFLIPEV